MTDELEHEIQDATTPKASPAHVDEGGKEFTFAELLSMICERRTQDGK